jgi:quercetin dioxygenase-like cupin family protein
LSLATCNYTNKNQKMTTENNSSIFPKGEKLTNGYFTGDAYLTPLLARDKNNDFGIGNVTFDPGARTNWHTHPKGQVLVITEGEGFYQEKGKPAQRIKKGEVVNIPENVEHWHGASADSKMVHLAITNFKGEENVVWLQPVSDAEYTEVNKK